MRALLAITLLASSLFFGAACTPTHPGRLLVTISTDLAVPGELARVEVVTPFATQSFEPPLPFSFVVAASPDRDPAAEVVITARGFAADSTPVVTRTLRTSFVANRTLLVPIVLPRLCSTVGCATPPPCPAGSVCTDRGCGPERIEPTDLAEARTAGQEIERPVDAGTVGVDPIPADRFCEEFADLQCDAVLACCPGLDWEEGMRTTFHEACVRYLLEDCQSRIAPTFSDPRAGYDAAQAGRVFREGRRLTDPLVCSLAYVDWLADSTGVQSILRGSVLVGGDCSPAAEDDFAALYSCQASSCQYRGSRTFACAPRACYDQPCVGALACADGLYCTSNLIALPGTCAARRPVGETCGDDSHCESYLCDPVGTLPRRCRARTAAAVFCPPPEMM